MYKVSVINAPKIERLLPKVVIISLLMPSFFIYNSRIFIQKWVDGEIFHIDAFIDMNIIKFLSIFV